MRSVILTTLSLSVLACGSGDPGPPGVASVLGTYSGGWLFEYEVPGGMRFAIGCGGSVGITRQTGRTFSGSFTIQPAASCEPLSGTLHGAIGTDGALHFELVLPGSTEDPLESYLGCTLVGGDSEFNGTFSEGRLRASAWGLYECGDVGLRFTLDLTFSGTD